MNLTRTPWYRVAELCPVECEISHLTEGKFTEVSRDDRGVPNIQALHHFIPGTLKVTEKALGWTFNHPGIKDGEIFVSFLNSDTTPSYSHIHIRL